MVDTLYSSPCKGIFHSGFLRDHVKEIARTIFYRELTRELAEPTLVSLRRVPRTTVWGLLPGKQVLLSMQVPWKLHCIAAQALLELGRRLLRSSCWCVLKY